MMNNTKHKWTKALQCLSGLILALGIGVPAITMAADPVDFATTPLANTPLISVSPNMLYVMDDSGSMQRDYMPDWANSNNSFELDSSYNTLAYNPATTYLPPANFTATGPDTTTYPSQTGLSVATGSDGSAQQNWRRVKNDPYLTNNTNNLEGNGGPNYWVTIPGEFCTRPDLKVCVAQADKTATHPYPAPIRWCRTAADAAATTPAAGRCQGVRIQNGGTTYNALRSPSALASTATITFGATGWTRVTQVVVNGQNIMRGATAWRNDGNGLAWWVASRINNCTNGAWGDCTVSGYSAVRNGNVVTISAPGPVTGTPSTNGNNGNLTAVETPFVLPPATIGKRIGVTITPTNPDGSARTFPYPDQTTKAAERTDCAGATCTYAEEMTNYANWFAYYRKRTLMMKTSSSLAFQDVGSDFNVGYMTIHPSTNQRLDIQPFTPGHKAAWYQALFSTADTNQATPLRRALSDAGRIFANRETVGNTFTDPMDYECQQNFTLLTTDGFWNSGDGIELDGSRMGNHDAGPDTQPPYREGAVQSNTLADVAKYYRDTDLRTNALGNCTGGLGVSVCETPTAGTGAAPNLKQTMRTLTLGLGVDGTLSYSTDYKTETVGDFFDIKESVKQWPQIVSNQQTTVDDLWHAAVNGDGTYFSAKEPKELVRQLRAAIDSIDEDVGNGATAAATSLNPVSGSTNFFYLSSYTAGSWTGNLEKRELDLLEKTVKPTAVACVEDVVPKKGCVGGEVKRENDGKYRCVVPNVTDASDCSGNLVGTECKTEVAKTCTGKLKPQVDTDTRKILFNSGGTLQPFEYASLTTEQRLTFQPDFLTTYLTQGSSYTQEQVDNLSGPKLVDYLKGKRDFDENTKNDLKDRLFRQREATLGDLVNSEPVYVGPSSYEYGDPGFATFKANQANRRPVIYVGSNDGMLHAIDAESMEELWAYIPSMVIPNMWKLADSNYRAKHHFYVNGDVEVGDVCISNCDNDAAVWKTILVGGLEAGGRGYFALDITSPTAPNLLWEFDASAAGGDVDLGYSYGRPLITKRASDSKWVVLFTSGYNNIPDTDDFYINAAFEPNSPDPTHPVRYTGGDGIGRLFVINAATGIKLSEIKTTVTGVDSTNPNGLAQISAFTPGRFLNNITTYVYGGDLDGNFWRFNIDNNTVERFATLLGPNNNPQPVTVKPNIGLASNGPEGKRVILFGTGKYLEIADLSDTSKQTLYGIYDINTTISPINNPRATNGITQQEFILDSNKPDQRKVTNYNVGTNAGQGWFIDLPDPGERQDVNALLTGSNWTVPTTVTESTACQPSGYSWELQFNYKTGSSVVANSAAAAGQRYNTRTTGNAVVNIGGKPVNFKSNDTAGVGDENGKGTELQFNPAGTGFQIRRSIWRELVDE